MLNFEDDITPAAASSGARIASIEIGAAMNSDAGANTLYTIASTSHRPHSRGRQAHHQQQRRREPVGAVQVQVGVGKVSGGLCQPLDAARGQHVRRHCAMEEPQWPDR